jgi:hypothetical protein
LILRGKVEGEILARAFERTKPPAYEATGFVPDPLIMKRDVGAKNSPSGIWRNGDH